MRSNSDKQAGGPDGQPDRDTTTKFMTYHDRASMLDALGWGLFFIWTGVAWLAALSLGVGLLGVAVIILAVQALRILWQMPVEGFWVVVGFACVLGGIRELLDFHVPLAPLLFIVVGVALLLSLRRRTPRRPA